jgi:hypothetical protein
MPTKNKYSSKSKKKQIRLPNPSNDDVHLSDFNYYLDRADSTRYKALRKASKKHGTLKILKRVNLIRNITKNNSKNKKILSKDVEYLKKLYSREKKLKLNKS